MATVGLKHLIKYVCSDSFLFLIQHLFYSILEPHLQHAFSVLKGPWTVRVMAC